MNAAPFRIILWQTGSAPRSLTRFVSEECLSGAVLCACQWLIWSNASGRGKREKYGFYRVESREVGGSWHQVAEGTLKDARQAWTKEDDKRVENGPDVRPLIEARGTTRHGRVRSLRTERRPQSRLAQLVQKMRQDK